MWLHDGQLNMAIPTGAFLGNRSKHGRLGEHFCWAFLCYRAREVWGYSCADAPPVLMSCGARVLGRSAYKTDSDRRWTWLESLLFLYFYFFKKPFFSGFALFLGSALAFGGRQVLLELLPAAPPTLAATRWGARLMGPALLRAWSPSGRQKSEGGDSSAATK